MFNYIRFYTIHAHVMFAIRVNERCFYDFYFLRSIIFYIKWLVQINWEQNEILKSKVKH